MGILYLVATPIGNMEDITLRALRILRDAPLIAAEDTRTIRKLLTHHEIRRARLISYTERSRHSRTPAILEALKKGDVALVSEAGTPAISDPGVHLVEAAVASGFDVLPVPGPSALTAALAASGLPTRRFQYLGFLPRQAAQRRRLARNVAALPETLVAFETPQRLLQALSDLLEALGDRRVTIGREITKLHEEFFRGTLSDAIEHFGRPRGEFTLVIEGSAEIKPKHEIPADIDEQLRGLRARGLRARDAVREVSRGSGLPRRDVYQRWLALGQRDSPGEPVS